MFDSEKELLEHIVLGEDTFLELKEVRFRRGKVTGPTEKRFADELAAFANSEGGVCVLGVCDRPREIVGIVPGRLDSVVGFVRHVCSQLIEPQLHPIVQRIRLPNTTGEELDVIKIEIRKSLLVHRSPSGYLVRLADEKRAMSPDYLARLFQQRSQTRMIRFDEQIVSEANLEALSRELWVRFRTSRTRNGRQDLLSKLRMARKDRDGIWRPTVAGILMAAKDPRRWLPNAFIQAVAYRGPRVHPRGMGEYYQLDAADISGPLDAQVDQACRFVARNMKVAAYKDLGRVDCPQFDMAAVFEAVVNAVAHRDYSIHGSKIRLRIFSDRLEVYSPGGIPNTLEPESLLHVQLSRNEFVSSMLAKCPIPANVPRLLTKRNTLMDKRGEGMRIIVDNSLTISGRRPKFGMIGAAQFCVTIYGSEEGNERPDPSQSSSY